MEEGGLRVVVAAPAALAPTAESTARRLAGSPRVAEVGRVTLTRRDRRRDPFGLAERVPGLGADVVILVVGARWGCRRLLPAPVVAGCVLALGRGQVGAGPLPVGGPRATAPPEAPWVVAAMAKDEFLAPTAHWASTLIAGGIPTLDLRADRARRSDLVTALGRGPGVVLYAGHGRARGWSGYQGLRWKHLESALPAGSGAGLVIAFACDTLKRTRSRVPFGSRLVAGGVARAYLGVPGSIRTRDAEALGELVVGTLASGAHPTPAHLVRAVDDAVRAGPAAAQRAWRSFRIVGDPCGSLDRTAIARSLTPRASA